ncbi:hypothetical protein PV08_06969 [Exophiala spinifera]|uniref:Uncharacterized protein n=1 Tax=Exophiala spinifera TaxID=91928 RepID=A0A0D2B5I8_9EURO|nr:uncharacterized protein PV08_06969 [Exophiala spinifera]KIW14188.1 hypothetical protein PV08_06969 [Exophiala spinifera]
MSASAAPLLNGAIPGPMGAFNEASEFQKILRIRDQVFSGDHPRLTVPAHSIRLSSSQTPSTVSQSLLNVPPPLPSSVSPNRLAGISSRQEETTKANGVASNVSEFDPILLTKSDDLVRAEIQLKRQRLERTLKEQFEQKRQDARRKPAPSEAKPDFDLPAVLAKVLKTPKSPTTKDEGEASDSFDANSLYSSRAPDSTPEGPNSGDESDDVQADEPPRPPAVSAVMGEPLPQDDERPASTNVQPVPQPIAATSAIEVDDEEEEGEYSPPEATAFPVAKIASSQPMPDDRDPRGRPLRRYSETEDNGRRPLSPSEANMRIVRNQITSPVAPVPSRVSPLAVAKDPPFLQNGRQKQSQIGRPGSPPSPDESQGNIPPRKRRKLERRAEKRARQNGGYAPHVKEENISPPPFHDVQPLGSGRLRPIGADRPIVIEEDPMQDAHYMPPPERYVDSPARPIHRQVEQLMPLSEPRAMSRASLRPMREDQDLRRVASMHNMRAEGPREYTDPYYESPARTRAVSYARAGTPAAYESPRYQREPLEEYDRPHQEVRVVRTPAPVYREIYDDAEPYRYTAEPMPPPRMVERIVVDSYGRRFREIIEERPPAFSRAVSVRRNDVEPSYDGYRNTRAGSVFVEPPPERNFSTADMPPPPPSYRRGGETLRSSVAAAPPSREFAEPGSLPRSASVMMNHSPRHAMYPDERPGFREPIRMGSVRPPAMRYEEAPAAQLMARSQSVRPGIREGSYFPHDRPPVSHEYATSEQSRYHAPESDPRHYDAQGREIIPMDGPMDMRPRGVDRY